MKKILLPIVMLCGCTQLTDVLSKVDWPWKSSNETTASDPTAPPPPPPPKSDPNSCLPGPKNRIGFDIIGLLNTHMDATQIAAQLPPNVPVGWLDGTFGKDLTNAKTLLATKKVSVAIITILNTVAPRNNQAVDSDGPFKGLNSTQVDQKLANGDATFKSYVQNRVAAYKEFAASYPCTTFVIKPVLEHDLSQKAYQNVADWVNASWPGVRQINNPLSGWKGTYLGSKLESHGESTAGAQVSSLDGKSLYDIDRGAWRTRTANQEWTLSWIPAANCRPGAWTPPLTRTQCVTGDGFKTWLENTYN